MIGAIAYNCNMVSGTKVIVTHKLNLELLKRINDIDYVVSIKAAPYSAGASSDF